MELTLRERIVALNEALKSLDVKLSAQYISERLEKILEETDNDEE